MSKEMRHLETIVSIRLETKYRFHKPAKWWHRQASASTAADWRQTWKNPCPRLRFEQESRKEVLNRRRSGREAGRTKKGCDIGYALTANSCEGVSSADACTVAASDAITAFAVPNPSYSSQSSRFFQVWWLRELPRRANHPAYFGLVNITWTNPFSRRQLRRLNLANRERSDQNHKVSEKLWIFSARMCPKT